VKYESLAGGETIYGEEYDDVCAPWCDRSTDPAMLAGLGRLRDRVLFVPMGEDVRAYEADVGVCLAALDDEEGRGIREGGVAMCENDW
jgi:hypothetical protein